MKLANPENDIIIHRFEDIRMLEYNYIKNYSNFSIDPNIFNEYFYNVKKKFSQMNQRMIKSSELNNTSRNNYHPKKLLKNYSVILPKIEKKDKSGKNVNFIDEPGSPLSMKRYKHLSP